MTESPSGVASIEEIRALPKIDIHSHLSGSISQKKLVEFLEERGKADTFEPFDCRLDVSNGLQKCFGYFDAVAKVVTDLATLKASTLHVFDLFAADKCFYIEVRTGPKAFKGPSGEEVSTKLQYLETIDEAIKEFHGYCEERYGFLMEIKVLLSVNRGIIKTLDDAAAQIDDIIATSAHFPDLVVGVDVCGNPHKHTAVDYILPAMLQRKDAFQKLPVTYHLAEVSCDEECQMVVDNMAALNIRRLGHCCYVPDDLRKKIIAGGIHSDGGKIGIEVCPTSNLVTRELTTMKDHHWPLWQSDQALVSINTDDAGMFACDITSECFDIASAFNLTREDIIKCQREAVESSFHPDKKKLLERFEAFLSKIGEEPASKKLKV